MTHNSRYLPVSALTATTALAIDQALKYWAMSLDGEVQINPFLRIVRAWNPGTGFGLSPSWASPWILTSVAILISLVVLYWTNLSNKIWHRVFCGLIAGGALGNALDRMVHGAVYDYLNIGCCGVQYPYAFNLADLAITTGCLALVFRGRILDPERLIHD